MLWLLDEWLGYEARHGCRVMSSPGTSRYSSCSCFPVSLPCPWARLPAQSSQQGRQVRLASHSLLKIVALGKPRPACQDHSRFGNKKMDVIIFIIISDCTLSNSCS